MSKEEVLKRLDFMRWDIENDLHFERYEGNPFLKQTMEKNVEALEYAIKHLKGSN